MFIKAEFIQKTNLLHKKSFATGETFLKGYNFKSKF